MRRRWLAPFTCLLLGCAQASQSPILAPTVDWISALSEAQRAVENRRFDDADAALAKFINDRKGTPEAREALFWRAVFLLDPKNRTSNPREATLYLDEYLANSAPPANTSQARALRGMSATLDSLDSALRAAQQRTERDATEVAARPASATGREEEMQKEIERLKEQLDKATAELDRIKRRLTAPRPPGYDR